MNLSQNRKTVNNLQKIVDVIWGRGYTLENRWKYMENKMRKDGGFYDF